MIVLLLPFYVITWALDGVMREVNKATAGAFLKARDKAKTKVKAWGARPKKKLRVPPKVQKAWAWTASHTAAAGRLAGRLIPEAVVEGARRGAAEGKERHREAQEIRPAKAKARKAGPRSDEYRQYSQLRHQQYLARKARRTGQPVDADNTPEPPPTVVEGEVVEQSSGEPTVVIPAQAPRQSRNWDKSPETPADARFHDLRESGWTGWIDQDGHAMTDEQHDQWCREQEQSINGHTPTSKGDDAMTDTRPVDANGRLRRDFIPTATYGSGTTADSPNGGAAEVTSVDGLRQVYTSTGNDMSTVKDQLSMASNRLQQRVATYEQATGHMTSDGFSSQTLSDVAGVQEATGIAAAKVQEALAALDAAAGAASAANQGLEQYRPAEEAVSSIHAPRSTASLRME